MRPKIQHQVPINTFMTTKLIKVLGTMLLLTMQVGKLTSNKNVMRSQHNLQDLSYSSKSFVPTENLAMKNPMVSSGEDGSNLWTRCSSPGLNHSLQKQSTKCHIQLLKALKIIHLLSPFTHPLFCTSISSQTNYITLLSFWFLNTYIL